MKVTVPNTGAGKGEGKGGLEGLPDVDLLCVGRITCLMCLSCLSTNTAALPGKFCRDMMLPATVPVRI